jgi:hypothetical protein
MMCRQTQSILAIKVKASLALKSIPPENPEAQFEP